MIFNRQMAHGAQPKNARALGHFWAFFLPLYFLAAAILDPNEVTNREYLQFVQATGHPPPDYWVNGRYGAGTENDPVVLVSFHEAVSYCRWVGRRLPTVDGWKSTCDGGKLKKRGDIWEWTSTEVAMGRERFKALCGPSNSCDCSHRYHPDWKNEVKGFRCARDATPLTWLPLFSRSEVFS
jgi:formylglycine-generating enzyme required for sulfatase activity